MGLSWMAWTWPTALFFIAIASALAIMTLIEWRYPGGAERKGILGLVTTRGDRLFITLLGSAFIHLGWLGAIGNPLWIASLLAVAYGVCVFRWV